jgi:hypothetical protein
MSVRQVDQTTGSSTSVAVSVPTPGTRTPGDLMVAVVTHRAGTGGVITAPAGWSQVGSQWNATTNIGTAIFQKVVTDEAAGQLQAFTHGASANTVGQILLFRDSHGAPIGAVNATVQTSNTATISFPSLTFATPGLDLAVGSLAHATVPNLPTGFTLSATATLGTTTAGVSQRAAWRAYTSASATGTTTASCTAARNIGSRVLIGRLATPAAGGSGAAYHDGVDDHTRTDDGIGATHTLEGWFRPARKSFAGGLLGGLHTSGDGGEEPYYTTGHNLILQGNGDLWLTWCNGGTGTGEFTGVVIPFGAWTHLATTLSAGTLRVYVNGALAYTAPVSAEWDAATRPHYGCRSELIDHTMYRDQFADAVVDNIRIWSVARTASEIQASMGTLVSMSGTSGLTHERLFSGDTSGVGAITTAGATVYEPGYAPLVVSHDLTAESLAQAQALTSPIVASSFALTAESLTQAQALASPAIAQVSALTTTSLVHAQSLTSPAITQATALVAGSLAQAQSLTSPAITQASALTTASLIQAQSLTSPAITQASALAAAPLVHAQALTSPPLAVTAHAAPNSLVHAQSMSSPATGGATSLAADSLTHAQALTSPAAVQSAALSADSLTQAQTLADPGLSVENPLRAEFYWFEKTADQPTLGTLYPAALVHAQAIASPSVAVTRYVSPDSLAHAQALASPAVTQASALIAESLTHAQSLTSPAITQAHAFAAGSLVQTQALNSTALSAAGDLLPDSLVQAQALGSTALGQAAALTASALVQAQVITSPGTGAVVSLTPSSMLQGQAMTDSVLGLGFLLQPASLQQAQQIASVAATQAHTLTADWLVQTQSLGGAQLTGTTGLLPNSMQQGQLLAEPLFLLFIPPPLDIILLEAAIARRVEFASSICREAEVGTSICRKAEVGTSICRKAGTRGEILI